MTNEEKRNIYNNIQNLYNMDFKSWQEVLAMMYNLVSDIEQKFENFEQRFEFMLGKEVTVVINKMYLDGTLASIINEEIFSDLNVKIDKVKSDIMFVLTNEVNRVNDEIKSINEQLDHKANLVYVDAKDTEILRQVEQGVTDEQLKNAVQAKIDDGTISSLAVGNDTIQNINIKDNVIHEQKLAFVPNLNICSNIIDVQFGISGTNVTIYLYANSNIQLWHYLNTGGNNNSINLNALNKSYTLANYKSLIWDLTTNTLEVINTGLSNKNKHILLATNENGIISVGYIANLYTYIRNYSDMRGIQQNSVSMFLTNPNSLYLYEDNKRDGYVYIKFDGSITLNTSRIYNVLDVSKTYDEIVAQLNSQSLYDNTQKTSYDNIKNCLRLASAEILVYDYINSLFTVVKHSSLDKYKHIVIAKNIDGALAEGQLKSLYLNKLINYNLLDTSLVQTDIWDSYRDKLNRIVSNQNANTITFSWITDVHTEESDKKCVTLGYNYLKRVADNISLDFMINGGDNILGHKGKQAELSNHRKLAEKLAPYKPFYLIGNHDANVGETPLSMSTVIHPRELYNIYGRKFKDEVVWGSKEQMYYYKDIEDKNIRMIFLNTSDYIYEDDGTGYSTLGGSMGVRQEQVRWFGEVALNTDKEVIIFTHIPLLTSGEGIIGTGETLPRNMIAFKGLLEAFKNGTRYTYSYTDEAPLLQPYFNCSVDVDFTNKGQGKVICVISGHVHLDQMVELNGIKHITTLDEYNDKWHESLSPERIPFTNSGFAFDIVNLNTTKRIITFYRFGAGEDREYSY